MAPESTQTDSGSSAFNCAAQSFGDWWYQKRHGKHDTRRAEMLARVATFPGGPELLEQAEKLDAKILVGTKKTLGRADGDYCLTEDGKPQVRVANTGDSAGMAIALWHELRHMKQDAANPGGMATGGQLKDARTGHLMGMIAEADAFTAETLMALQQKKAGHPEYMDVLLKSGRDYGVRAYIQGFLRRHPYESFNNDEAFARTLFTDLMTDGLTSYRAAYFSRLGRNFTLALNVEDFRKFLDRTKAGGTAGGPELTKMYGSAYSSVSPRALMSAFWNAQPPEERDTLDLVETTVRRAPNMTETTFQQVKKDILNRVQDIWMHDPEEPYYLRDEGMSAAASLKKAAASETPVPLDKLAGKGLTGKPRRGRSP